MFGCFDDGSKRGGEGWFGRNWWWLLLLVIAVVFFMIPNEKREKGKEWWTNPWVMVIGAIIGVCLVCRFASRQL